jgi:syntaxin 5
MMLIANELLVAKRKSLFDDPSVEIQELTTVINQDIKNINNQIAVLQQFKDGVNKNKQVETHTDTVVKTLKTKLQKTTKGFTQVLEIRTEVSVVALLRWRLQHRS